MTSSRAKKILHQKVLVAFVNLASLLEEAEKRNLIDSLARREAGDFVRCAKENYETHSFVHSGMGSKEQRR